jgi:MscS family membrane protein
MDFLHQYKIAGNEVWRFLFVFLVILISLVAGRLTRFFLEKKAKHFEADPNRELLGLIFSLIGKPIVLLFFTAGLHVSLLFLKLTSEVEKTGNAVTQILFIFSIAYLIYRLVDIVDYFLSKWTAKTRSKIDDMLVPMFRKSIRVTIVIIVALMVAESISGKPISTLIAGLGIGGLAFALAAQDSIKNLFGSIVILADKPFEIGDRIEIGGHDGPVEEVGFRSTKIRTLEGHLVTLPNSTVANTTVKNIGKRPFIRRVSDITITYDTPPEKVERAIEIIKEILDNHEGMNPEQRARVYFNAFNDASLNIIMIYWYFPPNYWDFQAFNQKVNLELLRRFNEEGIEFAFPTQTIYLANDDKRQLALKMLNDSTKTD